MLAVGRRLVAANAQLHLQQKLSLGSSPLLHLCELLNNTVPGSDALGLPCAPPGRPPVTAAPSRPFFSLPGYDDKLAKKYSERKLLGYSPQQMYDVVAAVENYHQFVPWCVRSTVLRRRGDNYLEAELEVGFQIFVER